jgi:hypothetical protein
MNRLKRAAILSRLLAELRNRGSWGGETHVQKAAYFLQELLGVPMGFKFTLYRHGPFSFDLRGELSALRADEIIKLEPQQPPYGPKLGTTERAHYVQSLFTETIAQYERQIDFICERLGAKDVSELERLSTALWVINQDLGPSRAEQARELTQIKPHIHEGLALDALEQVHRMAAEARTS